MSASVCDSEPNGKNIIPKQTDFKCLNIATRLLRKTTICTQDQLADAKFYHLSGNQQMKTNNAFEGFSTFGVEVMITLSRTHLTVNNEVSLRQQEEQMTCTKLKENTLIIENNP